MAMTLSTNAKQAKDDNQHDSELLASLERLEAAHILLAIGDDGTLRLVRTDMDAHTAVVDGFTLYTPRDAYTYAVVLSEHERRLLHGFKKAFGGTTEWICREEGPR